MMKLSQFLSETNKEEKLAELKAKLAKLETDLSSMGTTPYSQEAADAMDNVRGEIAVVKAEISSLTESARKPFETKQDKEEREARRKASDKYYSDSVKAREEKHGEDYHYGNTPVKKLPKKAPVKENSGYDATHAYNERYTQVQTLLARINRLLQSHSQAYQRSPASWSHAGDLAHVAEELQNVVDFMEGDR